MNLMTIAWKSMRQRSLASSLTALSVALGIMLMVAVIVINGLVENTFNQSSTGYDMVVGVKGSPLELVLKSIYYMGGPMENIPYTYYKKLKADPRIEHAIPITLGDTTPEGAHPIVGTIPEFFEVPYIPNRPFKIKGKVMSEPFDAVVGAGLHRSLGWDLGHEFQPVHGVSLEDIHEEKFKVVGVLAATGTPVDNAVFIHLDGFYRLAGHEKPAEEAAKKAKEYAQVAGDAPPAAEADKKPAETDPEKKPEAEGAEEHHEEKDQAAHNHEHQELPDEQKEVTAILIRTIAPTLPPVMIPEINEAPYAQAANPGQQIRWLMNFVLGNIRTLMIIMTTLIIIVSGVGIFVSIYNSMAGRRKEIAIMRALGAGRTTVFSIVLSEAVLLCLAGGICGMLLGHGLVFIASPIVERQTGLIINPLSFDKWELVLFPCLVVLASLIGIVPGLTAYRTDVASNLN